MANYHLNQTLLLFAFPFFVVQTQHRSINQHCPLGGLIEGLLNLRWKQLEADIGKVEEELETYSVRNCSELAPKLHKSNLLITQTKS